MGLSGLAADQSPGCAALDAAVAAPVAFDLECDLLVVGFGAAGAAAALEAAAGGLDVLLVDRFAGGGASWLSGGIVYAGGGTRHQRTAGRSDSAEAMADYLAREVGDAVSPETVRRYAAQSAGMIDWLEAHGAAFDAAEAPHETSYPSRDHYLYFSGNEMVPANRDAIPPAPRGHRAKGKWLSGRAMMEGIMARVRRTEGIRIRTEAAIGRLIVDGDGTVAGAELRCMPERGLATWAHRRLERLARVMVLQVAGVSARIAPLLAALERRHARAVTVRARHGVVLATGGFIKNRAMVARHAPGFMKGFPLGSTGCDGSGIRLGLGLGGRLDKADKISAWRFINPPHAFAQGVVVDGEGRRLTNEEQYGARLGDAMMRRAGGRAYVVIDEALRRAALKEIASGAMWGFQSFPARVLMFRAKRAATLDGLAAKLGMAPAVLRETIAANNAAVRGEAADPVGKSDEMRGAVAAGPFFALDISVDNPAFPLPVLTLGGLAVDEATGAVLRDAGGTIPGLYAVGRAARGLPSNFYVSGLSLGDCIWSGRRTAAAIAAGRLKDRQSATSGP
ncbi:3-oxo-5alpha-steroid 4-dehydrogenase [Zavarzinia compransoris]|nr:3-oxo-5alpha-steroid 4-dehydrogenase [Zavarzinia compransoris]